MRMHFRYSLNIFAETGEAAGMKNLTFMLINLSNEVLSGQSGLLKRIKGKKNSQQMPPAVASKEIISSWYES